MEIRRHHRQRRSVRRLPSRFARGRCLRGFDLRSSTTSPVPPRRAHRPAGGASSAARHLRGRSPARGRRRPGSRDRRPTPRWSPHRRGPGARARSRARDGASPYLVARSRRRRQGSASTSSPANAVPAARRAARSSRPVRRRSGAGPRGARRLAPWCVSRGQRDPELNALERSFELLPRHLRVGDTRPRGHQVELPRLDQLMAAEAVVVQDLPCQQPGHGLQSGVRVGRHEHPARTIGRHRLRAVVVDEAPGADRADGPVRQRAAHRHGARAAERHLAGLQEHGSAGPRLRHAPIVALPVHRPDTPTRRDRLLGVSTCRAAKTGVTCVKGGTTMRRSS